MYKRAFRFSYRVKTPQVVKTLPSLALSIDGKTCIIVMDQAVGDVMEITSERQSEATSRC